MWENCSLAKEWVAPKQIFPIARPPSLPANNAIIRQTTERTPFKPPPQSTTNSAAVKKPFSRSWQRLGIKGLILLGMLIGKFLFNIVDNSPEHQNIFCPEKGRKRQVLTLTIYLAEKVFWVWREGQLPFSAAKTCIAPPPLPIPLKGRAASRRMGRGAW